MITERMRQLAGYTINEKEHPDDKDWVEKWNKKEKALARRLIELKQEMQPLEARLKELKKEAEPVQRELEPTFQTLKGTVARFERATFTFTKGTVTNQRRIDSKGGWEEVMDFARGILEEELVKLIDDFANEIVSVNKRASSIKVSVEEGFGDVLRSLVSKVRSWASGFMKRIRGADKSINELERMMKELR